MENEICISEYLNASKDEVWSALTDKNKMKEWYFDIPDFELGLNKEFNFTNRETKRSIITKVKFWKSFRKKK